MNDFMDDGEFIYEPLSQYQNVYKALHEKNASEVIDQLIEKSQVDIEANRTTNREIDKVESESLALGKAIKKKTGLRGFLIFLCVLSVGLVGYGAYVMISLGAFDSTGFLFCLAGAILFALFLTLILAKINPAIKVLRGEKAVKDEKIRKLINVAWGQMAPLNALFTEGMSADLFRKTIPLINLDRVFDSKRLDYLASKFGLNEDHSRYRSALFVQSGDISGNPFFIARDMLHWMGTKTYSGTLTISWTTTSYVDGKSVTQYHTQTLRAEVTKPYPEYGESSYLVYGNEAAPDLSFSRQDSNAENLSQKEIDRQVKKDIKKLEKHSEKATMKGQDFTVMANSEFEVLFGATNRDNEVQFRLLFTPLAQKQLLDLMKDKTIAYGDDFDFRKQRMINYIYPEHLHGINLDVRPNYYMGYDIDDIRKKFVSYNNDYFKHMYFTFAPVLSIPLYQHQKPHEYIYKDYYNSYVSFYEHERVVNQMNTSEFIHPLSRTKNILKTSVVSSGEFRDSVKVTAYGFRTEDRVDYVKVYGGDGRYHNVPVPWVEYLPVQQDSFVDISVPVEDETKTPADQVKAMIEKLRNREYTDAELFRVGTFVAVLSKKI